MSGPSPDAGWWGVHRSWPASGAALEFLDGLPSVLDLMKSRHPDVERWVTINDTPEGGAEVVVPDRSWCEIGPGQASGRCWNGDMARLCGFNFFVWKAGSLNCMTFLRMHGPSSESWSDGDRVALFDALDEICPPGHAYLGPVGAGNVRVEGAMKQVGWRTIVGHPVDAVPSLPVGATVTALGDRTLIQVDCPAADFQRDDLLALAVALNDAGLLDRPT